MARLRDKDWFSAAGMTAPVALWAGLSLATSTDAWPVHVVNLTCSALTLVVILFGAKLESFKNNGWIMFAQVIPFVITIVSAAGYWLLAILWGPRRTSGFINYFATELGNGYVFGATSAALAIVAFLFCQWMLEEHGEVTIGPILLASPLVALLTWIYVENRSIYWHQADHAAVMTDLRAWLSNNNESAPRVGKVSGPNLLIVTGRIQNLTLAPNDFVAGYRIPSATTPINSIAIVQQDSEPVRAYKHGCGTDEQTILRVALLDWSKKELISTTTLRGDIPEDRSGGVCVRGGTLMRGSVPKQELQNWLVNTARYRP